MLCRRWGAGWFLRKFSQRELIRRQSTARRCARPATPIDNASQRRKSWEHMPAGSMSLADETSGHVQEHVVTNNALAQPERTTDHACLLKDTCMRTKIVPVAPLLGGGNHPLAEVSCRLTGVEMHPHIDPVVRLGIIV